MEIPGTGGQKRLKDFLGLVGMPIPDSAGPRIVTLEEAMTKVFAKTGKYGNRKTEYNGRMFDSALEARAARDFDLLRRAKDKKERVVDVQYQVRYPMVVNKQKICTYIADFVVTYADGRKEVVDAKGVLTDVYKLKRKLMLACHGIEIVEV